MAPDPSAGDRRHDLEHGARDVAALDGPVEERLGGIRRDRRECLAGRIGVGDRARVVRRRRRHRQDLAAPRIEHHDGAPVVAEQPDGFLLEVERQAEGEVLRPVSIGHELRQELVHRIRRLDPGQLGVVGALQTGGPVDPRRVADQRRHGLARVDPIRLAVGVPFRTRQQVTVAVPDLATDDIARRGDQQRVIGPTDEIGRPDDLPVAGGRREDGERHQQHDAEPDDAAADRCRGGAAAGTRVHATPRRSRRSIRLRLRRGAGGGSTPRSDRASSRPTTTALASSDEPP